ncbi:MAG: hypothetical protein ACXVCK_15090, partial [Bdellovibrionota bacterium]
MNSTLLIARKDLRSYFTSPVAFIIVAIFLLLVGWMFVNIFSYFIMNGPRFRDPVLYLTFLKYTGALGLGIIAYTALFAFLG